MSKQYKNVYTILEKVKKGEIPSYYKDGDGLFGRINFYKKPDLVKPYLHYLDEDRLDVIVDKHLKDANMIKESYQRFTKSTDYKKLDEGLKPDFSGYNEKFVENYKKFPAHIAQDIFKMFYNKIEKLKFEERNDKNLTKFKFLEKANNPVGKIMSENSNLKSAIYTRNVINYFITRLTNMDYIDPNASDNIKNGLDAKSEFDNSMGDDLDKMMESKDSKKMLEEAMQKAQDLCKEMDKAISDDIQEKMFEQANKPEREGGVAGKISPDYIRQISASLEKVNLSLGSLKDKIKKLLDKSVSYFSSKKTTQFDDLFNTADVSGLDDYFLLHPHLRKIFAEDLQVKETKSIGKIDIYIDISGSMSDGCGVQNTNGQTISKIDFAKAFVAKLKKMDILNEVYLFDTRVKKSKNDIISIAMIDCGGGTCIDTAVTSIEKNGVNALVITDAEDRCHRYSDKAFFIGIKGARFHHFNEETIKEYSQKNQVIVFDGSTIKKVNIEGVAI
jgi:hypothetical protein